MDYPSIAHPSEKGSYNKLLTYDPNGSSIAHPSEKRD